MEELVEMSTKELERYQILEAIKNKHITQAKGATLLKLSTRQVRNLMRQMVLNGPKSLRSKKRGKASNRCYPLQFKRQILHLIEQNYEDFGPTLVSEKLFEKHQIKLSDETLRQWMIESHLWVPKQRAKIKHRQRQRRQCFGELIQVDGSHHDWFEGRGPKCVLIVFIDDATSKVTSLHFAEGESLDAYFNALEGHIKAYGKPREIYSDRLSVFSSKEDSLTQFQYALKLLDIVHLTAKTPQAKGRVERVNQTLQDRLIKEMRLSNISTIEEANKFCEKYRHIHNQKFSKEPASIFDAHRPLETDLSRILCRYEERTLTNSHSICFYNKTYQICEDLNHRLPKKAKIEVRQQRNGLLRLFFEERELSYLPYEEFSCDIQAAKWTTTKKWQPPKASHPWKSHSLHKGLKEEELEKVI